MLDCEQIRVVMPEPRANRNALRRALTHANFLSLRPVARPRPCAHRARPAQYRRRRHHRRQEQGPHPRQAPPRRNSRRWHKRRFGAHRPLQAGRERRRLRHPLFPAGPTQVRVDIAKGLSVSPVASETVSGNNLHHALLRARRLRRRKNQRSRPEGIFHGAARVHPRFRPREGNLHVRSFLQQRRGEAAHAQQRARAFAPVVAERHEAFVYELPQVLSRHLPDRSRDEPVHVVREFSRHQYRRALQP